MLRALRVHFGHTRTLNAPAAHYESGDRPRGMHGYRRKQLRVPPEIVRVCHADRMEKIKGFTKATLSPVQFHVLSIRSLGRGDVESKWSGASLFGSQAVPPVGYQLNEESFVQFDKRLLSQQF